MALFTNKEFYSFWGECKQTQCSTDLVLFMFLPDTAVHLIKKNKLKGYPQRMRIQRQLHGVFLFS